MRVQIKLFATYRRYMPSGTRGETCHLEVPLGTRVTAVLASLGVPVDTPAAMVILINGRQSHLDHILKEGDVVSAFPAMAGG